MRGVQYLSYKPLSQPFHLMTRFSTDSEAYLNLWDARANGSDWSETSTSKARHRYRYWMRQSVEERVSQGPEIDATKYANAGYSICLIRIWIAIWLHSNSNASYNTQKFVEAFLTQRMVRWYVRHACLWPRSYLLRSPYLTAIPPSRHGEATSCLIRKKGRYSR
jgi:hypothetical protein